MKKLTLKPDRRIKRLFRGALAWGLLLSLPLSAQAAVTATPETSAPAGAVYVAGNPDCYPLEYYDEKAEAYRGVLPELLADLSEDAGVDFVYVGAGSRDRREDLAQNRQVELVSACLLDKDLPQEAKAGKTLLSLTAEGETYQVAFAYTDLATKELRALVEGYISDLPAGDLARRVATFSAENGQRAVPLWTWILLGVLCAGLAATAVWTGLTTRRRAQAEERRRGTDPGTGAWNRQRFVETFSRSVTESVRPLCYLVYLRFDIGRVNEYCGEAEAERLLGQTVSTLAGHTAAPDFFARVSGGGFACLRRCRNRDQAEAWTQAVLQELNEYGKKFGRDYTPSFYAGIYHLQPGIPAETALYAADQGCRSAQQKGVAYAFCDENLLRASRELEQMRHDGVRAIETREFQCYLQFIAQADTGEICGAELLSRWQHPRLGLLMPGKYVPAMEESGTISELDFYMFQEACVLLDRLAREGEPALCLFCNFSRKTVSLPDFSQRLKGIAQGYQFDHRLLYLEITESSMFASEASARKSLQQCKRQGFQIALDDVGSGHASFGDLANYPLDVAKLDRALLQSAAEENDLRLLQGIIALFHSIQVQTLCEGVETPEKYQMSRSLGVDLLQGFYIQRALPVEEALSWWRARRASRAEG